jgi:hypothetical protein
MVGGEVLREEFLRALSAIKLHIKPLVNVGMGLAVLAPQD